MIRLAAIWFAISLTSGCAANPPRSIYVLSKPAAVVAPASQNSHMPVLQVAAVVIPDYLDTTEIQWRRGEHELQASVTGQWSERLSRGVGNALRAALGARLPDVVIGSDRSAANGDTVVLVTIEGFDVWPDGHCILTANWTVSHRRDAKPTSERGTFTTPAGPSGRSSDMAVILGMSAALDALAQDVVRSLDSV